MLQNLPARLLPWLKSLRPRWAWICLACGLPWLLIPNACTPSGCGYTPILLSLLSFWLAALVLGFLGLRRCWRQLLFKVSRRLYLILFLVAILPVLSMGTAFLSVAWLGLGAQMHRTIQGHFHKYEDALKQAGQQASDHEAVQALLPLGKAWVERSEHVPHGVKAGFLGLVYDRIPGQGTQGLMFRLVQPAEHGFRLVSLDLRGLPAAGQHLWGGRMDLHLDWSEPETGKGRLKVNGDEGGEIQTLSQAPPGSVPVYEAQIGVLNEGGGLFRAFSLPPVARKVVDWPSGRPMLLTLQPRTSLLELFAGFGSDGKNFAEQTALAIAVVSVSTLLLIAFQLAALLTGLLMTRSLGRSVHGLFKGVERLSRGDFTARVRPLSHDQVGALTRAFNDMARQIQRAEAEREERLRLEEELRVAREVQMRLLPDMAGFAPSIQAAILPAREVAGDYFDVMKLADGRMAFLIADVSGKGTSAAFYAAETKGVLAALDKAALDPVGVVERLNAIWWASHPRPLFLTLAYGVFDPRDGRFAFVRAGHPPAFLRRQDGRVERLAPKGIGIGLCGKGFRERVELCEGLLERGDALIFYTDGLSEAMNPRDELYGEDRLEALLHAPGDPKALILGAVEAFAEGRPMEDDLTLLVLSR